MVKKYRLVAKGMQSTVVYLESVLGLEKADTVFHSGCFWLLFQFCTREVWFQSEGVQFPRSFQH